MTSEQIEIAKTVFQYLEIFNWIIIIGFIVFCLYFLIESYKSLQEYSTMTYIVRLKTEQGYSIKTITCKNRNEVISKISEDYPEANITHIKQVQRINNEK